MIKVGVPMNRCVMFIYSCLVFRMYLTILNMFIEASWSIHVLGIIRLNMFEPFNFSQSHQRNLRICDNNDNMFGCLSRGIGWVTVEVIQKSSKIHSAGECSPSDSFAISNSRFIPQSYDRSQPWRSQGPEGLWKDWKARFSKMSRERVFFVEACMYRRQDVCMFETIDTFVGFSMVLAKCAAGVCRTHVMLSYNRCWTGGGSWMTPNYRHLRLRGRWIRS